jgi:plastocyanin domain-containing protein
MNKIISIIIILVLAVCLGIIFTSGSKTTGNKDTASIENVQIKDGVQYITINASAGYSPRISSAKAGIPTKLIMKTDGAYDCSSSVVIPSMGFQKVLPSTGETEIDLGVPKAGVPLRGVCGMGMYNFQINFQS